MHNLIQQTLAGMAQQVVPFVIDGVGIAVVFGAFGLWTRQCLKASVKLAERMERNG